MAAPGERAASMEHVQRSTLPYAPRVVWDWHQRPGAFERLSPPWQPVEVVQWAPVANGARQRLRVKKGRWWSWDAQITGVEEGVRFTDVQTSGPFARWEHTHSFEPAPRGGCVLEDRVVFDVPLGALGRGIAGGAIARDVANVFAFRHARTRADLDRHAGRAAKRIAVSGASGLVGGSLVPFLTSGGHDVLRLVRRPVHNPREVLWRHDAEQIDAAKLEGVDAVIHLAGEPLAQRWTESSKRRIRESRVEGTKHLCDALARLSRKPEVLVCASAVGYYGDRGDEVLDESSATGAGYLAEVADAWEKATERARQAGIRVVNVRIGIVLDPRGGALLPLRLAAAAGLSGRIGTGAQYVPWIALDDLVGLLYHAVFERSLSGPLVGAAPSPVPQVEFAETLARVLGRPSLLRVPATELGLLMGDQGREMLLFGQRTRPAKALASGFRFLAPDLEGALRGLLGRPLPA